MAIDPPVAAMIGAAVGAGGAIIAQVTTAVFTDRRESRKLEWDRKEAQAARFADTRLQLFTDILADTRAVMKKLADQYKSDAMKVDLDNTYYEWLRIHARYIAQASLIAPAVHNGLYSSPLRLQRIKSDSN
jgi:predicted ribosomally synthesized peptide with SipW-like signal peptide